MIFLARVKVARPWHVEIGHQLTTPLLFQAMIKTFPRLCRTALTAVGLLVAACSTPHMPVKSDAAEQKPVKPLAVNSRNLLNSGIDAYHDGDYATAIKRLSAASDPGKSDKATQLEAIKYLAFSYCVTSQTAMCRLQFERVFRIDPAFDLEPGEKGHPLWGPVFERAKKAR